MLTAAFKEQRDVEGDNRDPPGAAKPEKPFFAGFHHRVNDPFEPRESLGIRKDTLAEKRAIDPTFFRANAGKFGGDRLHRRAAARLPGVRSPVGHRRCRRQAPTRAITKDRGSTAALPPCPGSSH